ncbi:MAG TPA: hypothetical protein VGB84_00820 [Arachidicoccus sp.]
MNLKKFLLHGVIAGILSSVACLLYMRVYQKTFETDFSKVMNAATITSANIFACLLIAIGYALVFKLKTSLLGWLNIIIVVVTFASILTPIGYTLPLDVQDPEMFPGLAVPMHFFPALAFFTLAPFFRYGKKE